MWSRINADGRAGFVANMGNGTARARSVDDGAFAFICEKPMADYAASQPPCDLMAAGCFDADPDAGSLTYNFAFQKDDTRNFTAIVSDAIERLSDDGELDRMYYEHFYKAGTCGRHHRYRGGVCAGCAVTASLALLLACLALALTPPS